MALFAQSLNTLKKRATNLANELVKGDEAKKRAEDVHIGQPSAETQHALKSFVVNGQQSLHGFGEGPIIVRYEVQNGDDGERDLAAFPLPSASAALTLGHVRKSFPVPGRYHFRFKATSLDGGFGGYIWMDLANDAEVVPFFRGDICMKALRVPDDADAPPAVESLPNSALSAAAMASASMAPASAGVSPEPSPGSTPPRAQSPDSLSFERPSPPQQFRQQLQQQLPQAPPQQQPQAQFVPQQPQQPSAASRSEASSSPMAAPGPPDDLMDFGGAGGGMGLSQSMMAQSSSLSGSASPPSPPVVLDREKLKAEREAWEQKQVRDAAARQAEQLRKDEQLKADKVQEGNKVDAEMNAWAKTSDGQAYKDIKVLLSTMHTVTWAGCQWKELPLSELVSGPSTVKKHYRRAILLCHPDKQTEAEPEQQVRADRIFQALNEAFKISGDQ
mmetsp:Transcript_56796/g.164790  ORF Transcript_56796/g.164790 Transcript_56796/m.164790 type:complete len:445 (+) Transcript_56796:184-1518(+)